MTYYERNKERCKAKAKAWARDNPERRRAIQRKYDAANPGRTRVIHWRRRGIDPVEAQAAHDAHDGRCAICRRDAPGGLKGWHVDHDHITGIVRGILCCGCNLRLGWYEKHADEVTRYLGAVR